VWMTANGLWIGHLFVDFFNVKPDIIDLE